jgi:endo-1,4-beta-xylanase
MGWPAPAVEGSGAQFCRALFASTFQWEPLLKGAKLGAYDFSKADAVVDWALARGMQVSPECHPPSATACLDFSSLQIKGHTLVWHVTSPQCLASMSASRVRDAVLEHIRVVVGRYSGKIKSWDVVNEALHSDASGLMADTPFSRSLGPQFMDECFMAAHMADPNALLIYNDNKVEGLSRKSDAMFEMLKGMRDRNVPLHGVGLQAHFDAAGEGVRRMPTPHALKSNISRLGSLGLTVNISEMDVRTSGFGARYGEEERDAISAGIYRDCLTAALSEPSFDGVTFWGFCDKHSWVHSFYSPDRPLLWDAKYQPKPALRGVQEALRSSAVAKDLLELSLGAEESWGQPWFQQGGVVDSEDALDDEPNWEAGEDYNKQGCAS